MDRVCAVHHTVLTRCLTALCCASCVCITADVCMVYGVLVLLCCCAMFAPLRFATAHMKGRVAGGS